MGCMCGGCEECLDAQRLFRADFRASGEEGEILDWFPEDY